jgi:hypothetical protein
MAITVGGLYQNSTKLYGMRLSAGAGGMEAPALWAHAVEDEDAARGMRGGEVAFTAALPGAAGLLPLARALRERGASALVVTVGARIAALPPGLAAFCEAEAMPLFTIPPETPISDMTRDFCHRIVRSENAVKDAAALFQVVLFQPEGAGEAAARLARRGFSPDGRYRFACLAAPADGRALLHAAEDAARGVRAPFLVFPYEGALACVLLDYASDELDFFLEGLLACLDARPTVGVGPARDGILGQGPNLVRALRAMRVARARGERVLRYDDMGLNKLLCAVGDEDELRLFRAETVAPLEAHDRKNGTELTAMLETYVACGGNLAKIAEVRGVHRNTVANQLKKMRALTGLDPTDLNDAALFKAGLMIRDIL